MVALFSFIKEQELLHNSIVLLDFILKLNETMKRLTSVTTTKNFFRKKVVLFKFENSVS